MSNLEPLGKMLRRLRNMILDPPRLGEESGGEIHPLYF